MTVEQYNDWVQSNQNYFTKRRFKSLKTTAESSKYFKEREKFAAKNATYKKVINLGIEEYVTSEQSLS